MKASDIKTIAVIGAGQMGGGIAQVAAGKGYTVLLSDASVERAQAGKDKIGKILGKQVDKGKMKAEERAALLEHIHPIGADLAGIEKAELVVEAATEDRELKIDIFKKADSKMKPDAILASNTSSISITRLAGQTSRPGKVIGMHFMNPVPLMKLVEIVNGVQTDNETTDTIRELAEKLGKTVITSKDQPGFVVNRMLIPFLNEACFALQEGLGTPEDIDQGAKLGLNHPMGPLELADSDRPRYAALHRRGAAPRVRRRQVPSGDAAPQSGGSRLVRPQGGARLLRLRRAGPEDGTGVRAMSYETILSEASDGIVTITVNRPDKLNALDPAVLRELTAAVEGLGNARAAILTGAGKAFVAGADIAAMQKMTPAEAKAFSDSGHHLGALMEQAKCPIIAAVNGFALGGGTELALACDFIYASEKAKFGQPEVNLGLMPGFGGTQRLARRVGIGRARELVYTGAIIDAQEALRIGLANQVVLHDELLTKVREVAATIASKAPLAVAASKRVMARGYDADLPTANELEATAFSALFGSEDQREGTAAFVEKRKAAFKGR